MTDTAEPEAPKKITSADLVDRLRRRYSEPEWIVLTEVRNATGYSRQARSADAMALSTYPSRGCQLIGFEIKVSRSDLVKEIKDPDKSVALQSKCDRWFLVVSDPKFVVLSEVPATWGVLVARGDRLHVLKDAPELKAEAWPRDFVASLLRNAASGAATKAQLAEARAEGVKAGEGHNTWELRQTQRRLNEVEAVVKAFEEESGERLDRWAGHSGHAKTLGARVRAARDLDLAEMLKNTQGVRDHLERVVRDMDAAIEKCRAAQAPPAPG